MTTREYYRLVFDGHSGRDGSDSIRVMQNATETDVVFHCYYQDGTEYVFQAGDTGGGSFIDSGTGLDYAITGTVTPTAGANILTWARDAADVALPSTYSINFEIVSTVPKSAYSFSAIYVVLPIASGSAVPVSPSLTNLIKAWASTPLLFATSMTYNATYINEVDTAVLEWPDGSAGVYTVTSRSAVNASLGMTDAYTATHTTSGLAATQTAATRNTSGMITIKPALTVA